MPRVMLLDMLKPLMTAGLVLLCGASIGFAQVVAAPQAQRTPPDQLKQVTELPDPFLFRDGSRVKSKEDWARRRAEISELVQTYEYGHLPPADGKVSVAPAPDYQLPKRAGSNADKPDAPPVSVPLPEGTKVEKYLLSISPAHADSRAIQTHLVLTIPPGSGKRPVIIRGDLCWGDVKAESAAEIAGRGYILASFDRTEIVPDKKGPRDNGAYTVYPDHDFGALAAWAWGYHRVLDYLLTRPEVDGSKIVVTGHSRGGKTALLAGAMDERIALTVPNNSGCGGAGCYRYQGEKSESIVPILRSFPYWFQPQFGEFIDKIDRLPIDQHEVKALVAPRALLTCEALGDIWANPSGTQKTHVAAKEVYEFLGAGDKIAIHFREGKHEQNLDDWKTLLDRADQLFFGKTVATKFNNFAFPIMPSGYAWEKPGSGK